MRKCNHKITSLKTTILLDDRFFALQEYQRTGICKVCSKIFYYKLKDGSLEETKGEEEYDNY